jgi:hypothetical protein
MKQRHSQSEAPHGEAPFWVGVAASDMLGEFLKELHWSPDRPYRWTPWDYVALADLRRLEERTPEAQAELESTSPERTTFDELLHNLHVALPFGEAERQWMSSNCFEPNDVKRRQEIHIVSAGLRRVVYGRDLLRRWWAWRRETDEFGGQGTLELTREALRGLSDTFAH